MAPTHKRAEARTRYYVREEAGRLGWDVRHPSHGGSLLEEQEVVDYFADLKFALKAERPDFACVHGGRLAVVIECKNEWRDLSKALREAEEYADTINRIRGHNVRVAVGVAGTPDKRVQVLVAFRVGAAWVPLVAHDYPLSQIPTPAEIETALENGNGTTDVQLPDEREFFSTAISISRLLRLAKIEESVRPKVVGAVVLALYHGEFSVEPDVVLENINTNVKAAIRAFGESIPKDRRDFLAQTLELSTEAHRLRPKIGDIIHQLERLNVRSIMRSGVDFLGQFYETFLRYGQDSKKLGIVFTPRHITRFCAELADVRLGHTVYDPACGTGGFLVAAFDRMMREATTPDAKRQVKESIYGCDTNSTVWALAVLNMFFRGDGKSHITYGSCFDSLPVAHDLALLNPPFSQEGEPETDFIDHALAMTKPGGRAVVVVKASIMADADLTKWRRGLVAGHHVEAVVTLPPDLFYPTAAQTVILAIRAHAPDNKRGTFLARIENDGFEISKKRRVPTTGSQLSQVLDLFRTYHTSGTAGTVPGLATVVPRNSIKDGDEICAERWLPSAPFSAKEYDAARRETLKQMSLSVANYPDVVDEATPDYEEALASGPKKGRPTERAPLSDWFNVGNGRSSGSKNYPPGPVPYISSGEQYSGIVDFVEPPDEEIYPEPCLTVSCFGPTSIQPWRFCARGNGGSAVRILKPRFAMTVPELLWFAGQVNAQRWRFHFGRMALPTRLRRLDVDAPPRNLPPLSPLADKIRYFRDNLQKLMEGDGSEVSEQDEDEADAAIARQRLAEIEADPKRLIRGAELETWLTSIENSPDDAA